MLQKIMKTVLYKNYTVKEDGNILNSKGKILKPKNNGAGYFNVAIWNNGKASYEYVHRIIAICFIPNNENKKCVNHINGIKSDNRVENLEWCNHSENTIHAYKNGLWENQRKAVSKRASIENAKHHNKKVINIETNQIFESSIEAANFYNINVFTLRNQLQGRVKNKTKLIYLK